MTPPAPLRSLTGLRFFAAAAVMLFHFGYLAPLPWFLFGMGRQAVSLFFILSGLVMTYSYREQFASGSISRKTFLLLRLARILPMHVLTMLLATAVYSKTETGRTAFTSWLASLFCVQIYWPSTTNALHWNAPSWSVSCELFFYALFPLLLLPMMRFFVNIRRLVIAAAAIYAIEVGIYFATAALLERQIERYGSFLGFVDTPKALTNLVPLVPVIRIAEFAIGMCLGLIVARGGLGWLKVSRLRRDATLALTILGIYLLERTNLSPLGEAIEGTKYFLLFVPLFSVLMATLVSGTNIFTSMLEHRLVVLLGEASYSLYLLHYPMGMLLLKRKTPIEYVLACVAVVLLSVLTFAFLERPLTVYLQGRVRQRAKHGERPAELVK